MKDERKASFHPSSFILPPSSFLRAGVAQLVEHQPSKLRVASSSLVSRSRHQQYGRLKRPSSSGVERLLGKEEVMGSNPISGLGSLKHSFKEDYSVWRRRSLIGRSRTSTSVPSVTSITGRRR